MGIPDEWPSTVAGWLALDVKTLVDDRGAESVSNAIIEPTGLAGAAGGESRTVARAGATPVLTTQTAVAIEMDMVDAWPRTLAGVLSFPAHLTKCADALTHAMKNSGIYPDVALRVATDTTPADREWFAEHGDRTHRLRASIAGELVLSMAGDRPAQCVIVQQTAPGIRFIVAVPDGVTSPRVEPQAFMDSNDASFADRDVFLNQLFDVLCRSPGQPINVSALIANTHALMRVGALLQ